MAQAFSTAFLAEIKKKLEEEEMRLVRELKELSTKNGQPGDGYTTRFPNLGDKEDESAAEVAEYSDNLTVEHELESALRDVKGSLERLKKGTYGICKYCSKPIDERRLEARPMSSACVECKKLLTQEV